MAKPTLTEATDAQLFAELDNCKIAKVLLSATAYKKQWLKYESAIKKEINSRNDDVVNSMSDDELLSALNY